MSTRLEDGRVAVVPRRLNGSSEPQSVVGVSTWAGIALAALSGLLYWAALPPLDLWPFAFVSLAPLLVALRGRSPRHALLLGGVQGFIYNCAACAWLPAVIRTFGEVPWVVCGLIALVICLLSAGRAAMFAWLSARAARRGWSPLLVLVLAFGATEALYPLLFPSYAAVQVHRVPVLMQLAELGGPALVGIPLLMASIAVAELVWARVDRRPADRRLLRIALAGPAAALLFGGCRVLMVERQMAAAPTVNVGIVQGNLPYAGASLTESIESHRALTVRLQASAKVDLVVWPETALSGVLTADSLEPLLRGVVTQRGRPSISGALLTGAALKRGDLLSNAAVLFAGDSVRGIYDKVHPLAFGEYVPFGDTFPALYRWIPNAGHVARGTGEEPLLLGEHRISTLICYEDILASAANRAIAHARPDLLVNITNDSWFGDSNAAVIHLALAKFRAVEHRRYLVHAANSGVSAFVDPTGRATGMTPMLEEATRVETLRWMRSSTVYERTGDAPWWVAGVVVLGMGFVSPDAVGRLRRRRRAWGSKASIF
jgi:apolipoprotein N-acyltransferase